MNLYARKCSQCQKLEPVTRLTRIGNKDICPTCLVAENTQPRRRIERVRTKIQKTFQFSCSCCRKKIPDNLEQKIEEEGQTYILCPRCYNFRMNILTTIRRINENERERDMYSNKGS